MKRHTDRGFRVIAGSWPRMEGDLDASRRDPNYNLFRHSTAVTDFKEFSERLHVTIGQPGWEAVADFALDWTLDVSPVKVAQA